MIARRCFGLALAALGLAMFPPLAHAHRGHDAMTVLTLAEDGAMTVSHRFEAHDLEPALAEIAPQAQASLDDPEAIEELKTYLLAHFSVSAGGTPVPLAIASVEIGVRDVRIDYSGTVPGNPAALELRSTILRDIYPRQVNQVLVRRGSNVQTLRFAGSEAKVVALR
ncbi:DUF6702 family protein [Blastomonas sp.]|uniref:DUF6702 family protein n=1 Tax=Blastomonas sp. TaxID=1909299 RepID=UPI002604035B|nr:DUF6702 family protein [Blastomonas sp.]MDM7954808.1 hypothetical protein [Blastomonas sp.]